MERTLVESHSERIDWLSRSWSSIDFKATHRIDDVVKEPVRPPDFNVIATRYVETATNWRRVEDTDLLDGRPISRKVDTFDGRSGARNYVSLVPKAREQVLLQDHFGDESNFPETERPIPLFWFWVARTHLRFAILRAEPRGSVKVLDRECDSFLIKPAEFFRTEERLYALDAKTSLPLKVVRYRDADDRRADRPLVVWTATRLETVQGYPMVRESSQQDYTGPEKSQSYERQYKIISCEYNRKFDKSHFQIRLNEHPDASVFDTKPMPVDPPSRPISPIGQRADAVTSVPSPTDSSLRAERPTDWSAGISLGWP